MSKFKVGDRVRCLREVDGNTDIIHKEGIVIRIGIGSGCVKVEFESVPDWFSSWWCPDDSLELVPMPCDIGLSYDDIFATDSPRTHHSLAPFKQKRRSKK